MPSAWNMFVKKIYEEGKSKNKDYEFKQALKDASKRKSEMKHSSSSSSHKSSRKSKSSRRRSGGKSRRRRHHKSRRH